MSDPGPKNAWSARAPLTVGIVGLVLLVGGFGSWSVVTNISGAIIASGRIEVDQNRQVVQHPDGGVVAEILVEEGDIVTPGQVLVRLDETALRSQLAISENQLFELVARRGRLEAERDDATEITFDPLIVDAVEYSEDAADLMAGQVRLMTARTTSIATEIDQLGKRTGQIRSQIEGLSAQKTALREQQALIARELADQQILLDKGLAQASRVLSLRREEARLSGTMGDLESQIAQAEGRITEIDIEILKLGTQRREEAITRLRDLQFRELELREQRRAQLEQLSRLEITAPVSGIVYGLQVFAVRSVIRPADPVLFIVPQDRPLVISAQVEPIHIDKLYLDQDVTLRFSTFDQRETPELNGTVSQISADSFKDEGTSLTYYRVVIVLSEGEITRLPAGATLIPGMPVEAFILTDDRTPMAYLVKPLADYFTKAFRE